MDEAHLLNAVRYVSLNPVRARLFERAQDWIWSSARAHFAGLDDAVVKVQPVLERVGDFGEFLDQPFDEDNAYAALRRAETIGRPIGDPHWIEGLEERTGRSLAPAKRGRRPALDKKGD